MMRKKKSDRSVTPSLNGDESLTSKSSRKSLMGKLLKRKSKKQSVKGIPEMATSIPENSTAQKQAQVQNAFLNTTTTTNNNNGGSRSAQVAKKPYMLKIALLLVDAKTRRFELLQLEFDSDKALVSDALSQIPIHVTESVLSTQTYTGVCGANGIERKRTLPLFDFCSGNDVLVAIPSGTASDECARLAKPILVDKKVIGMLSSSGINAEPWVNAKLPAPRAAPSSGGRDASRHVASEKKSDGKKIIFALVGLLVVAILGYFLYQRKLGGEPDDSSTGSGSSWKIPSGPSMPKFDTEMIWTNCHAACDSSRDFMEKITGGSAASERGEASGAEL